MSLRLLLCSLLSGLALACGSTSGREDAELCEGVTCTAGTCQVQGGAPACVCSAFEEAAGVTCAIAAIETFEPGDAGNSPETALALPAPGESLEGSITLQQGHVLDVDYYALDAQAQHHYRVQCTSKSLESCELSLLDASGAELDRGTSYERNPFVELEAETTARYYVRVQASASSMRGTYALSLTHVGPDPESDTVEGAAELVLGVEATGGLQWHGDRDVFVFTAVAGHAYRLRYTGESSACGLKANTLVPGPWWAEAWCSGGELSFFAPSSGTLSLSVLREDWDLDERTYRLQLDDLGPDDHGNTVQTATPLAFSAEPQVGHHEAQPDVDVFSFPAQAGHYYAVDCEGPAGVPCKLDVQRGTSEGWGYLDLRGTAQRTFKAPGDQTLSLHVRLQDVPAPSTYTLRLQDLGRDDHGDAFEYGAGTALLALGSNPALAEVAWDSDFFVLPAEGDRVYLLSSGCPFALHQSGLTFGSSLLLDPKEPGPRTYGFMVRCGVPGPYALTVERMAHSDDHPDVGGAPARPALGEPTRGIIEYTDDSDSFAFELVEGQTVTVRLEASEALSVESRAGPRLLLQGGTSAPFTAAWSGLQTFAVARSRWDVALEAPEAYVLTVE